MAPHIVDIARDFEAETSKGKVRFQAWISDQRPVLFPYPKGLATWCG